MKRSTLPLLSALLFALLAAPAALTQIPGNPETGDSFGAALAAGDFDGDGRDDLAVGVPEENISSFQDAGAVNVLYGSASGLGSAGDQFWSQRTSGVQGGEENQDNFGAALAAGDFGGNGTADLAAGVPGESVFAGGEDREDAGAVNVLHGGRSGLTTTFNQILHQGLNLRPAPEDDVALNDGTPETEEVTEAASSALPEAVALHAPYPNPVRDRAMLAFALPEAAPVRLAVYDLLGRTVAVLADGTREAGEHEAVLDAAELPSGTYLVRLEAGGTTQTQRLTLVR